VWAQVDLKTPKNSMDTETFGFGEALAALKSGKKVSRKGWNGSGMFLYLVPANEYPAQTDVAKAAFPSGNVPYRAYCALKTAQGDVAPWSASQTDILAEDWFIPVDAA
jgi:hypothetical protein